MLHEWSSLKHTTHLLRRHSPADAAGEWQQPRHVGALIVTAILFAQAAVSLDVTVVNVAIPSIQSDLGGGLTEIQLAVTVYMAAFAIFIVPAGRFVDIYGPRRVWRAGAVVYISATLFCGLALGLGWLVAARIVQGLGAACLGPAGYTLVAATIGPERRGRAIGVVGSGLAIFAVLGPAFGGAVTSTLGWRWLFFLTIPLVGAGTLLMLRATDPRAHDQQEPETVASRLDIVGTLLFGGAVVLWLAAVSRTETFGPLIWPIGFAAGAIVLGIAFTRYERRRAEPMIPFEQLKNPAITGSLLVSFVNAAAFFGMFFYLVIYLQSVENHSAFIAGVMVAPAAFGGIALTYVVGALVDRFGPVILLGTGVASATAAMVVLSRLESTSSYWSTVFPALVVNGIGYAFTGTAVRTTILNEAPKSAVGRAMSLNSIVNKLAASFGIAGTAALFHLLTRSRLSSTINRIGAEIARADVAILERLLGSTAPESGIDRIKNVPESVLETIIDDAFVIVFASTMRIVAFVVLGLGILGTALVHMGRRRRDASPVSA